MIKFVTLLVSLCLTLGCASKNYRFGISDQPIETNASSLESTSEEMSELPWSFQDNAGKRFVNDYWDICTTLEYDYIVDSLPTFYEALLIRYKTAFGDLPIPTSPMKVYLFSSQEEWQEQLIRMLGYRQAEHWFQLESGGITIDGTAVLYHLDRRGRSRVTLRIAAHEGWHQYAEKVCLKPIPTWLDEAIGTWMEGFRLRRGEVQFMPASNWDRLATLRRIVSANRLSPLKELMNSEPSDLLADGRTNLLAYYAELWGLMSFIVEYEGGKYFSSLRHLLNCAVDGTLREPTRGWLAWFTDEPKEFEQEYKEWVVDYCRPGAQWR